VAATNLLNFEDVTKSFGREPVLNAVSLGVETSARIGVVGRNGGGKSTLLKVMAGLEGVDSGRVTVARDVQTGVLSQLGVVDAEATVRDHVLGDRPEHVWASDTRTREVLESLLGGYDSGVLDRPLGPLSGGEQRRVQLAALLMQDLDLLLLDEPTNHLDVEAVAWLAQHLRLRRRLAVVVVTHDRWFLDEVSNRMWEVVGGAVDEYEGGYSAYVLAKAERDRQASVEEQRRNNLIRKELAWLRRGPPARTSKPKFRIDAANQLITAEPPARDEVELLEFAGARLGKTVFEIQDLSLDLGPRRLLNHVTWQVGPGDRIGIIGVNGAGKTSLVRVLLGLLRPAAGSVVSGVTVKPAFLSQHLEELDPKWRVLEAVEKVAQRVELGKGRELTAKQLCERLGFGKDAQWTPVRDLSGGERRRLQLTRLLMAGPNVLVLDEPTNDFDVETLTALEDLLDSFAGSILVISHDRYFLERVCDRFVGLLGDAALRDLPGGVDEYLQLRRQLQERAARRDVTVSVAPSPGAAVRAAKGDVRARQKVLARLERQLAALEAEADILHESMTTHATDHVRMAELQQQLTAVLERQSDVEDAWLTAAEGVV
jgi:ATP-binding cassette subfamily F protein uup